MNKTILLLILSLTITTMAVDNVMPDTIAPAGIEKHAGPQLIVLGFDDNRYEDGVRWVVDTLLGGRLNPAGTGNKATFDGTKMLCSFFVISNADQRESWREAYEYGCGIGNHTVTHEKAMFDEDSTSHMNELGGCTQYIVNDLGLPPSHIKGFRTPFLAFQEQGLTFKTIKRLGMIFDASVENGTQRSAVLWTRPYYPWTLDYTINSIGGAGITEGLWQVPHVNYLRTNDPSPDNKGFDSGLWPATTPGLNLSGPEALEYFKGTLDFHYGTRKVKYSWETDSTSIGLRAPMDMGFHSDYYSIVASDPNDPAHNPDYINLKSTVYERRQALMDFVNYALTFPDVRFVRMQDVVKWMKNPAALADKSQNSLYEYTESIVSENLLGFSEISAAEGAGATLSANTSLPGIVSASATIDNSGNYVANRQADLIITPGLDFSGVDGITITYKSNFPLRITFEQSGLRIDESSHFFAVPTSETLRTVTLPVNALHIEKPYWSTATEPFNLSKVTELSISPMVSNTSKTETFEITNIQLYGTDKFGDGVVPIAFQNMQKRKNQTAINGVRQGHLQLNIPQSGLYKVELFTPTGRLVQTNEVRLQTGITSLDMGACATGTYMARISGMGIPQAKMVVFQ